MTNPNEPALVASGDGSRPMTHGLTKREYFAAMAMQGILANKRTADYNPGYSEVAIHVLAQVDALIAELN